LKKRTLWLFLALAWFVLGLDTLSWGSLESTGWTVPSHSPRYTVTRIIDGDTIEVAKLGKVRYIGINTPELSHPKLGIELLAAEACEMNKRLVLGKTVALEYDVQTRDRYGRILAYVYTGSTFVNAYLVETGYAQLMTVPPNVKYAALFQRLQQKAVSNHIGLWSENPPQLSKTGTYVSSIKSFIFHRPDCRWAQAISPSHQVWFKTESEATEAGYQSCKICKP